MFRDMYDQKIAEAMTRGKGLGLSGMISRQLSGQAADGPALDTRVDPAKASRAYQLNAPDKPAPSLPLEDGSQAVRMLQQMAAGAQHGRTGRAGTDGTGAGPDRRSRKQQPAPLAGHRGSVHRQPQGEDWAANNDQWSATASNRGTAISPADAMATRTAVAQLGEHTPEGFVASIWQHAQRAAKELGVDARALVAQAALETGWGKRHIKPADGSTSHNLFGIKANGWSGQRASRHPRVRRWRAPQRDRQLPCLQFAGRELCRLRAPAEDQPALPAGPAGRHRRAGLRPWPAARRLCHRPALCGQDRRDRRRTDHRARRSAVPTPARALARPSPAPHRGAGYHPSLRNPMSSVLSTGTGALLAFQRALATTSHNVANLNTPGYSRQKVDFATADPQNYGYGTVGNGTRITDIRRTADQLAISRLLDSSGELARLKQLSGMADRVNALFSDAATNVSGVWSNFFDSVSGLSSNAAGTADRQNMLDGGKAWPTASCSSTRT
jgi:flagellum-specific peptidoglycan hydrolase FlgJ